MSLPAVAIYGMGCVALGYIGAELLHWSWLDLVIILAVSAAIEIISVYFINRRARSEA